MTDEEGKMTDEEGLWPYFPHQKIIFIATADTRLHVSRYGHLRVFVLFEGFQSAYMAWRLWLSRVALHSGSFFRKWWI